MKDAGITMTAVVERLSQVRLLLRSRTAMNRCGNIARELVGKVIDEMNSSKASARLLPMNQCPWKS